MPGLTFLVVDDNELQRRAAESYLWKAGHRVMFAVSLEEVEAVLSAQDAQLVVVSAGLPRGQALAVLAVAARPRRDPETFAVLPPPPVVIGAGPAEREGVAELIARGAAGTIDRPYDGQRMATQLALYSVGAAPATVLVVDDSPTARRVAVRVLLAEGHRVFEAGDGKQGLAMLRDHPEIDLVLSDVVMPRVDGFGMCQAIRAQPDGRDLPIILLTSLDDIATHSRAIEVGADDFLTKPISATELELRVRTTLRLKGLQRRLARRNHELEQALDARQQLSRMLVHDFGGPLTRITFAAELLDERCGAAGMADEVELAAEVLAGATQLADLTGDLLRVARLEEGIDRPESTAVPVAEVIAEAVADHLRSAAAYQVRLRSQVVPDLVVHADRKWLYRVLQNLLANAVEHSRRGSEVVVSAAVEQGRDGSQQVRLQVTDQGPGIPAAHRELVFEQFAQLPKSARRGSGLGLAFCRLAIEASGGAIGVGDRLDGGSGAAFWFTLPKAAE